MYVLMSPSLSILWGLLTPVVFIGSIYVKKPKNYLRDHPDEIKRRFLVVGTSTFVWNSLFYYLNSINSLSSQGPDLLTWVGLSITLSNFLSTICSLSITMVLFLGNIFQAILDPPDFNINLTSIRAYIMAPIFEEAMYRSCLINALIAGGFGWNSVMISSLIFGLSHFYRIEDVLDYKKDLVFQDFIPVLFQVCFTTLFGLYVGYVYVVTGSLFAVVVLHSFCNFMGLPCMKFLDDTQPAFKYKKEVGLAYVVGIFGFFALLGWVLRPEYFGSWHTELIKRLS